VKRAAHESWDSFFTGSEETVGRGAFWKSSLTQGGSQGRAGQPMVTTDALGL